MNYLLVLPEDMQIEILAYLNYDKIISYKQYFPVLNKNSFWVRKVNYDFLYPRKGQIDLNTNFPSATYHYSTQIIELFGIDIIEYTKYSELILTDLINNLTDFESTDPKSVWTSSKPILNFELIWYVKQINNFYGLHIGYFDNMSIVPHVRYYSNIDLAFGKTRKKRTKGMACEAITRKDLFKFFESLGLPLDMYILHKNKNDLCDIIYNRMVDLGAIVRE